jgi:HAD superfamily hydrolase (TIGR01509 family)
MDDAVLFDMDGVIVNSEDYWHAFERERLFPETVASGDPTPDEVTGMHYREIYDVLAEAYEMAVDADEFVRRYDEAAAEIYGERVSLMAGFAALLADLRDDGRAVGIVSSSPQDWIGIVRDRFDLGPFDLVCSAEDVDAPGKPEPHIYEHAARELGLDPADCTVVEDSAHGVAAATRAGAFTVAYRRQHNAEADLSAADAEVGGPEELRAVLFGEGGDGD